MQPVVLMMLIQDNSTDLGGDGHRGGTAETRSTRIKSLLITISRTRSRRSTVNSRNGVVTVSGKSNKGQTTLKSATHSFVHIICGRFCVFESLWQTWTARFISLHWKWRETQCSCSSLEVLQLNCPACVKGAVHTYKNMECWRRMTLLFWSFSPF